MTSSATRPSWSNWRSRNSSPRPRQSASTTIRDDKATARKVLGELAAANGDTFGEGDEAYVGSPQEIADQLRPAVEIGFRHLIIDALAPYDAETIDRLPEVRELLSA